MTDEEYDEFHGTRDKHGIEHFFDEGCQIRNEAIPGENPFWKDTKEIYYSKPHKLQKTVRMTAVYYAELKAKHKTLFYIPTTVHATTKSEDDGNESSDDLEDSRKMPSLKQRILRKRKRSSLLERNAEKEMAKAHKRIKLESSGNLSDISDTESMSGSEFSSEFKLCDTKPKLDKNDTDCDNSDVPSESCDIAPPTGPLLQLPTGSGKVYTRLSDDQKQVWKGPYKPERTLCCSSIKS